MWLGGGSPQYKGSVLKGRSSREVENHCSKVLILENLHPMTGQDFLCLERLTHVLPLCSGLWRGVSLPFPLGFLIWGSRGEDQTLPVSQQVTSISQTQLPIFK